MKFTTEKLAKTLFLILIMVISINVLTVKIPESKYVQQTIDHLEKSQNTVMTFSGTTLTTSLALSALPDDFASPLAETVSDLNTYFIFMFAALFVEKLIVVEGTKIALTWIIPAACILYILNVWSTRDIFKSFANKLMILGISLVIVIPFSTHFTEHVCANYMAYVDETIAETNNGATKINDIMASDNEDSTIFDKLTDAFKTAIQGVNDLLTYFKNVIKKCINSVAILMVTTFGLPILILMLFRWLLSELFSLHLSIPETTIRLPHRIRKLHEKEFDRIPEKEDKS
ncbi:MAG: hypothetical protein IKU20_09980 [Lachnospiraceae bacterium]|nr:hypothetical protein [Lachnospiraceae bacterium]